MGGVFSAWWQRRKDKQATYLLFHELCASEEPGMSSAEIKHVFRRVYPHVLYGKGVTDITCAQIFLNDDRKYQFTYTKVNDTTASEDAATEDAATEDPEDGTTTPEVRARSIYEIMWLQKPFMLYALRANIAHGEPAECDMEYRQLFTLFGTRGKAQYDIVRKEIDQLKKATINDAEKLRTFHEKLQVSDFWSDPLLGDSGPVVPVSTNRVRECFMDIMKWHGPAPKPSVRPAMRPAMWPAMWPVMRPVIRRETTLHPDDDDDDDKGDDGTSTHHNLVVGGCARRTSGQSKRRYVRAPPRRTARSSPSSLKRKKRTNNRR